ncbi:MAG: type II toxin-antitoxin system RelE/ParE family toxin [Gammaproteobacteria bacterium]
MAARRRLILSPSAVADLEGIYRYIAEDDPTAAGDQVERILTTADGLCDFPERGRSRPYLAPNLRSCVRDNYVVFYYPHADRIDVARVLHSKMDIEHEMLSFITKHFQ